MLKKEKLLKIALSLQAFALSVALSVYAYMGLFSRYIGDDYCHSSLLKTYGFFGAIQHHYLTFSNRYMILVMPFFTSLFGARGTSYLPGVMIALWVAGLVWLLYEVDKLLSLGWSRLALFFYAALIAFFSILQAPDRYQSIYWEASSIIHFVPFVFATHLFAGMLLIFRKYADRSPYKWSLLFFLLTFLIGGFGEMTDVLIFAAAFLIVVGVLFWHPKGAVRRFILWMTGSVLVSSLLSVIVMALSPGNAVRVKHTASFTVLLMRIFTFPVDFVSNSLKTVSLPNLLIFIVAFSVAFLIAASVKRNSESKQISTIMLLAPVVLYGLLLVNFTPSAYVQSYPIDRALFGATALFAIFLALEGSLLGIYAARAMPKFQFIPLLAYLVLFVFTLYPLRAAWQTAQTLNFYRERAAAWDERDAQIRAEAARGDANIVVIEFDSLHGIKEIDEDSHHWVNRCAAEYYGVETITAILP